MFSQYKINFIYLVDLCKIAPQIIAIPLRTKPLFWVGFVQFLSQKPSSKVQMRKHICCNWFCIASLGIRHLALISQTQLHHRTILDRRYLGNL